MTVVGGDSPLWQMTRDAWRRIVHALCAVALVFGLVSGQIDGYLHDHAANEGVSHHQEDHGWLPAVESGESSCAAGHCHDQGDAGMHAHDDGVNLNTFLISHFAVPAWAFSWWRPRHDSGERAAAYGLERPPRAA